MDSQRSKFGTSSEVEDRDHMCSPPPAIQIWNQLGPGGQRSYVLTSHPLSHRSIGAFWNLLGSMTEIELPVFVLLNTCR